MIDTNPLAVFGCSWAFGTGVLPEQTFGHVLSTMLGSCQFTNCAIEGSSNTRSLLQLMNYIKNHTTVVDHVAVFCVTTMARGAVIQHNGSVLDLISRSHRPNQIVNFWAENFSSLPNLEFELHKNIIAMQQICKHNKIKDFYIRAWEDQDLNLPGIDQVRIYPKTCVQLFGFNNTEHYGKNCYSNNNEYLRVCGHPSVSGHKKIAETLYTWIKDQIV